MIRKTPTHTSMSDATRTRLDLAQSGLDALRAFTLPLFANPIGEVNKGGKTPEGEVNYDPVTQADIDGETQLRDLISAQFPDDQIEGEEHETRPGTSGWSWTLDPIDGTRAFVAGVPVWSTLIGVSYNDKPVLGLIDHPALGKRYIGDGKRTWVQENSVDKDIDTHNSADINIRDIHTKPCPDLRQAVLACTEPLAMFTQGQRAAYEMIRRTVKFSRLGLDAFGYALTAQGRIDLVIEASLKPCDVRALIPIIEGAGGVITNWQGGSAVNGGAVVAAGDKALLDDVYPYLQRALDTRI